MNPYQNPNYFNPNNQYGQYGGYNPMLNAQQRMQLLEQQYSNQYAQPAQQYTQVQQSQQMPGLNGRYVQGAENINVNDVPMDGTMALFPKQDMSEIYGKLWDQNGSIKTIVYKPVLENQEDSSASSENNKNKMELSDESMGVVMRRFDELSGEIEKLSKAIKPTTSRTKKEPEVKANE